MALTLRVTSFHSQALGADSARIFGAQGGAIGRALDNDWVLPDPDKFVSSHHAQIVCHGGSYSLKDISTNGTFVNGSPQPVGNNVEQQLFDGDRIQIAEYEIMVALDAEAQQVITGPTGPPVEAGWQPQPATGNGGHTGPTSSYGGAPVPGAATNDIMDVFDDAPVLDTPTWPTPTPDHVSALDQNFSPQPLQRAPPSDTNVIPEDYDLEADETGFASAESIPSAPYAFDQPPITPAPQQQPAQPAVAPAGDTGAGQQAIVALLMAAGLDQSNAQAAGTPTNLSALGQILGITTQGLIDILAARSAVKSQFRVPMTTMRPVENNALKSSVNAAEALMNLFVNQNPAYLNAVDSFVEGFEDIKAHQMAMMAGMRAAFDSMLQRFDPEELEQRFKKRKSKSMLRLPGGAQIWDMYKDLFDEMTQDADANFQRLFGEEFARAYEEQMQRLTAGRGRMRV